MILIRSIKRRVKRKFLLLNFKFNPRVHIFVVKGLVSLGRRSNDGFVGGLIFLEKGIKCSESLIRENYII